MSSRSGGRVSDAWIGKTIGNCRIEKKIGEGGCGSVYLGVDEMLARPVAVKVLHGGLAARRDVAERFRSEAHTLARLSHPNVATLYSFHRAEDTYLMVMEFVEGKTFDELIRAQGHLPEDQAIPLFCQALEGIHHAHLAGVVHRDLKGSNVMRNAQGVVKVMDFGIARAMWTPGLTRADHPVGTPEYMSPEQVRAEEIDFRADIYSLGVLLFKMLTGRLPFGGDSPYDIMRAQVEQLAPSVRDHVPTISPELDEVILRALAKRPEDRFESAGALREALEAACGKEELASTPSPLPPPLFEPSPDAHTTPIPLDAPVTAVPAAPEAQENPTHIVPEAEAETLPGERPVHPQWLRARAALAPLATGPALAGLALAVALLGVPSLLDLSPEPEVVTAARDASPRTESLPASTEEPPQVASLEPAVEPAPEPPEPEAGVEEAPRPAPKPVTRPGPRPAKRAAPARPEEATGWVIRRE